MMRVEEFIRRIEDCAKNHKTIYIKGCFGAPLTPTNKKRYTSNLDYNRKRAALINACSEDTFGFDCINLVKGILGGWTARKDLSYGGVTVNKEASGISYGPDHVPDIGADGVLKYLKESSLDFSKIVPGELVWMPGHVGVYIGEGKVVECTPKWTNNVQYSNLGNNGYRFGNWRLWVSHGKLPWVDYDSSPAIVKPVNEPNTEPQEVYYYTVVNGDNLSKIAKANNISLANILKLNPQITNPNIIYPGQKIRVK